MKNIVLIVEGVPECADDCPFSKWHPYPPIIETPGYYECQLGGVCRIEESRCLHMKTEMKG